MLAEVTRGPDGVHATWMLPIVAGTDSGSLKQKGIYWRAAGAEAAGTGLESRQEQRQLRGQRTVKPNSHLEAEQFGPRVTPCTLDSPTAAWVLEEPHLCTTHSSQV